MNRPEQVLGGDQATYWKLGLRPYDGMYIHVDLAALSLADAVSNTTAQATVSPWSTPTEADRSTGLRER
jgi:hypothetical protein